MTDYLIVMGLGDLGEISSVVAGTIAEHKGFSLNEDDYPVIAQAALDALRTIHDRADFARFVARDLAALDSQPDIAFEPEEGFPGVFIQE